MAVFPSDSVRTKDWGTEVLTDADQEGQLDLLHSYFQACLNGTSGHSHTGSTNQGPKLSPANLVIASQAAGDTLYASSATAWARLAKGTAGQYLSMNAGATSPEWRSSGTTADKAVATISNSHVFAVSGVTTAPTVGATYTNNGVTYTVVTTTADKLTVYATGTGDSEASGTLTKQTGTGDATIAFSVNRGQLPAVDGSLLTAVAAASLNGPAFGAWNPYSTGTTPWAFNTNYLAATDGFVCSSASGEAKDFKGWTHTASPATGGTVRLWGRLENDESSGRSTDFMTLPVKKGEYWYLEFNKTPDGTYDKIYWLPLGA